MKNELKRFRITREGYLMNGITILLLLMFFMSSCEKELSSPQSGITVKGSTDAVPSQYFNWDTSDYIPTPPGYPTIHVPWFAGAPGSITTTFDSDVYSDHKASDGWEMLYSTCSSTIYTPYPYFILYNKYRGLMRIYQFNDNQTRSTSSKILAGINWAGNGIGSNKILNFLGKEIVDINTTPTSYYAVEASPKNGSELPVSPNKWYMLQYELAYDQSITKTQSQTPPTLSWYVNYNDVSEISLGGTLKSTVPGSAGSSSLSSNVIESALTGIPKTIGQITYYTIGKSILSNNPGFPDLLWNGFKSGFTTGLNNIYLGGAGKIYNILSAVLGGSSAASTGTMNIDATLSIKGTNTSSGVLFPGTSVYMPGALATNSNGDYYVMTGLLPVNNNNLGVFNLTSKPVVPVIRQESWLDDTYPTNANAFTRIEFGRVNNSSKIVFNPAVLAVADVQIVQEDNIINYMNIYSGCLCSGYTTDGTEETVGVVNPTYMDVPGYIDYGKAVRFVIKVTPKNTSIPPSLIVKTFVAD